MFMYKNKKIITSVIFLFCLMLLLVNSIAFANKTSDETKNSISLDGAVQSVFIPSVDDVREDGYPKNENGETYGPDVKELDNGPDLVLVRYGDGYGYVRQTEMDDDGVESPKDVAEKTSEEGIRKINVYLQDGITRIGTFDLKG